MEYMHPGSFVIAWFTRFDGARMSLLGSYGCSCWDDLLEQELDRLNLLAEDSEEL
jgi:hypothetical protein